MIPLPAPVTIGAGLNRGEPTRGTDVSRMARRKRQYGSGCLLAKGKGWAIGWRELEIAPDGTRRRVLRYERLEPMSRRQAAALLKALPPLARAMVGLAILSGLRRGELFALRWQDIDEEARALTVLEAVYDGTFGTPKTEAGLRQIPLSETALSVIRCWKQRAARTEPAALVFSTRTGNVISPKYHAEDSECRRLL